MADSPKATESAQALMCAYVDKIGKKIPINQKTKLPIPEDWSDAKTKWQLKTLFAQEKIDTPGVSWSMIDDLLTDDKIPNSWYHSSVFIANKVFDTINKFAGPKLLTEIKRPALDLFYARGDTDVMGSITTLFKVVKEQTLAKNKGNPSAGKSIIPGDLNKWSPADIYYATTKAKVILKDYANGKEHSFKVGKNTLTTSDDFGDFSGFNSFIKELINDGELFPLSLKKSPTPGKTKVSALNFKPGDVDSYFAEKDIGYKSFRFTEDPNDIKFFKNVDILITVSDSHKLQFRDKGSSGSNTGVVTFSYQAIIVGGAQSLDGSFGGASLPEIMKYTSGAEGLADDFSALIQQKLASNALKLGKDMIKGGVYNLRWYENHKSDSQVKEFIEYATNLAGFTLTSDLDKQEFFQMLYESPKVFKLTTEREQSRRIAQFLYAKLLGGRLITKMNELNPATRDLLVLNMLKYAGSRSTLAGPHLKAGDASTF
tara:strand:+ start:31 stop:1485 length:1455 start_codon:yes stop_codon:yes gene_type:complete